MRVVRGLLDRPAGEADAAALTIGNFDGVHRGHQALLAAVRDTADRLGGAAVVMTFDPHPRCVLDPENCPPRLSTAEEKNDLLERAGMDVHAVLPFDVETSRWSAASFCDRLAAAFPLRELIVGHDFALGHRRQGDVAYLTGYGAGHGFTVRALDAVSAGGEVVSSSRVREALASGDLERAARLLGRPPILDSAVERGAGRGVAIGYPTANLAVPAGKCLPRTGIYATWVRIEGEQVWRAAATSVGWNPTFDGDRITVECFLIDWEGDLYGRRLRTAFVARIRDEERFPDVPALTRRIALDVAAARRLLSAAGEPTRC